MRCGGLSCLERLEDFSLNGCTLHGVCNLIGIKVHRLSNLTDDIVHTSKRSEDRVLDNTKELHQTLRTNFVGHQGFSTSSLNFQVTLDLRVKVKLHVEAEQCLTKRGKQIVVNVLDHSTDRTVSGRHQHGDARGCTTNTTHTSLAMSKRRETSRFICKDTSLVKHLHVLVGDVREFCTEDSLTRSTTLTTEDFTGVHSQVLAGNKVSLIHLNNQVATQSSIVHCHTHEPVHQGLSVIHVLCNTNTPHRIGIDFVGHNVEGNDRGCEGVHHKTENSAIANPDIDRDLRLVLEFSRDSYLVVIKDIPIYIAPKLQNFVTLCAGLLGIIFHDLFPPLFDVVGARLDCSFNLILTEVGTSSKLTEITTRHLVTLNGKLRLFHVVGIRVRVEVPDRHVGDHRYSLHYRVVSALIVPARILFIHRKRTLHYASTKQGALKGSRTKMLGCVRLFKLIVNFLFHLLGCNHSRFEGDLRGSQTGTGTNVFDRFKLSLESTKTLTIVLCGLTRKQRLNASRLLCLLHLVVSLNVYGIYHTLRERSRINSDRKLITTEEHLGHLPKGSKHFSFSNFDKYLRFLGVSKFDIRSVQTAIIAV